MRDLKVLLWLIALLEKLTGRKVKEFTTAGDEKGCNELKVVYEDEETT